MQEPQEQEHRAPMDDDAIRGLVGRLARPHRSGGQVVERATLLAAGADFRAIMTWIEDHGGVAEETSAPPARGGLHGARLGAGTGAAPLRFILPAAALR